MVGVDGFRASLDNEQLTGATIFSPLDIHRTAIMALDM